MSETTDPRVSDLPEDGTFRDPLALESKSPDPALTEAEQEELRALVRDGLEREHEARLARFERRRTQARDARDSRLRRQREAALARMRESMREDFYREKGYQKVMEHGRERWVTNEEYSWLQRVRSKRRRSKRTPTARSAQGRGRWLLQIPLYAGMALLAAVLALLLTR